MQTLGLSPNTTKIEPIWKTWLWPDVSDEISAKQAAKNAMYGTFFISAVTSLATMFRYVPAESLIDALLFFLAGVGIGKMYRAAAIFGFALYILEQAVAISSGQGSGGIMRLALLLLLFTAIRATFSYNKLRKQPPLLPSVEVNPN